MTQIPVTNDPFDRVKTDVAAKVRKLLALAEDPAATPEEAQSSTLKAQQLMTKYSIDMAMVSDSRPADQLTGHGWTLANPYATHKVSLVNAVARANDCRAIYADLGGGRRRIEVVGFASDVAWVETLSRSLEVQLMAALATAVATKPADVHGRTFSAGFVQGFVAEIAVRLHRARSEAIAEARASRVAPAGEGADAAHPGGRSVELVLVAKAARVDDEFRVRHPGARSVYRQSRLRSWSGYGPGRAAGSKAALARGAVGGGRRRLPA